MSGAYISFGFDVIMHVTAIYLFLTTGDDPGWADEHQNDKVPDDELKATIIESSNMRIEGQAAINNHQKVSSEEESSDEDNTIQLATESSQGNSMYDG